ncbi:hypothetical protein ACFY2W_03650 [Streptomyces sp. NPDC001262]|uniref:hypothetical protein n=1 Tax=Streptomyces sp. NPDC001262 TaxID=3364552 RepID=UPI003686C1A6
MNSRVPRNYGGIASALRGSRRTEFLGELGEAPLSQAESVLRRWWCEAILDTDPNADRIREAALEGTLPTTTVEDVLARREARGLPVD